MTVTYQLEEKKEKLIYNDSKTSYLIHQRSIKTECPAFSPFMKFDDRSYSVKETLTEGEAISDQMFLLEIDGQSRSWRINYRGYADSERMVIQEEVEKFEQDWSNLWNPQAKLELD